MSPARHIRQPIGTAFYKPVQRLSAVIPALNEADYIRDCIGSLLRQPEIIEIIVADGGSSDATIRVSEASHARVVRCRHRGRGFQISEAIASISADAIIAIHADCRLCDGSAKRAIAALNRDSRLAGGAFRMSFTATGKRFRFIAFLNNLRALLTGISFGDQAQFMRCAALKSIGGFPQQMLMEDVELSLRMKSAGRTILLPKGVIASARRWEAHSCFARVGRVLHLFSTYLLMRRMGRDLGNAETYYRKYYFVPKFPR
jgi:glycosyltransferase involved in cell wall biosynthesis